MACVRAAVDAAQQNGVKAWLYDEDRWPSGAAGGIVLGLIGWPTLVRSWKKHSGKP